MQVVWAQGKPSIAVGSLGLDYSVTTKKLFITNNALSVANSNSASDMVSLVENVESSSRERTSLDMEKVEGSSIGNANPVV